jgi:hypothetical protein
VWIADLGRGRYVDLMGAPACSVRPLDESTWSAFAALVDHNNGIFGGCWCMGFHPEGAVKDTTAELNRDRKLARVRAGTAHAALVFDGGDCLGWCQFGTPEELPRIKSRAVYEKGQTASSDWRIACRYAGKGHRRQGVAAAALAGALDLIAGHGRGNRGGLSRERRLGAGRVPVQRGTVDLREAGVHPVYGTRQVARDLASAGPRLGPTICGVRRICGATQARRGRRRDPAHQGSRAVGLGAGAEGLWLRPRPVVWLVNSPAWQLLRLASVRGQRWRTQRRSAD